MSRWLERRSVQVAAVGAWAIALAAAATQFDSRAPFRTVMLTGFCAGLAYQVLKRRWWTATALAAITVHTVLTIVTEGDHSRLEHKAVSAMQLVLIAYFVIAIFVDDKAIRRPRKRDIRPSAEEGGQSGGAS